MLSTTGSNFLANEVKGYIVTGDSCISERERRRVQAEALDFFIFNDFIIILNNANDVHPFKQNVPSDRVISSNKQKIVM